jgi:hypothetical protein
MNRRNLLAGLAALGIASIAELGDAMEQTGAAGVLFIAGFGPIIHDTAASRRLYGEAFCIAFKRRLEDTFILAT